MKTTRNITISISQDNVIKSVRAESACIALLAGGTDRPAVITSDNRALLRLMTRNAVLCLAGELLSVIDAEEFCAPDDASTDDIITLPLRIEGYAATTLLSHYFERYVAAMVLAECYGERADTRERFVGQARSALQGLRWSLSLSTRRANNL